MANSLINSSDFGRPSFINTNNNIEASIDSLFSGTSLLSQLKPTLNDPNSLFAKIERLFWKIISFFIDLAKPSPAEFGSLINCTIAPTSGTTQRTSQVFKQFEKGAADENPGKSIFAECEQLLEELRQLNCLTDQDQKIKKKISLREKIKDSVLNLSQGKSILLPATSRSDANIYYLLNHADDGKYSFKIIGCDALMSEVSEIPSRKIGGKERIFSQVFFDGIPAAFFHSDRVNSLFCEPLLEDCWNANMVKSHLETIKDCRIDLSNREDLWVVQSANQSKALGLVSQEIIKKEVTPEEGLQQKAVRKRLQFKTKLASLFDFYKEVRFDIAKGSANALMLQKFIQAIARESVLLQKKNCLSKDDLAEIQKELSFIEKTLAEAESKQEISLENIENVPPSKVSAETLPLGTQLKAPALIELDNVAPRKGTRSIEFLEELPVLKESTVSLKLLGSSEKQTLQSNDYAQIGPLLNKIVAQVQAYASKGEKEKIAALVMEFTLQLKFGSKKDSFLHKLTIEEAIEFMENLTVLTFMLLKYHKGGQGISSLSMTVLKLGYIVEHLNDRLIQGQQNSEKLFVTDTCLRLLSNLFALQEPNDPQSDQPYNGKEFERALIQLDYEGNSILKDLLHLKRNIRARKLEDGKKLTEEQRSRIIDNCQQQKDLTYQFFKIPSTEHPRQNPVNNIFSPYQNSRTKPFENPMLFAALTEMKLQWTGGGHVVHRLSHENKFPGRITYRYGEGTTYQSDYWSESEIKELKKDYDRLDSLKLPEATVDNPQAVFDKQVEALFEKYKKAEMENPFVGKSLSHHFRKEELTSLLSMTRFRYPQLEAIAFIKEYPHLLANPDVRNYLDIVMFDVTGSQIDKFFEYNLEAVKNMQSLLSDEIDKYLDLVNTQPEYYDQLLYILSVARKFEVATRSYVDTVEGEKKSKVPDYFTKYHQRKEELQKNDGIENKKVVAHAALQELEDLGKSIWGDGQFIEQILDDPSLSDYHYRSVTEYLLVQASKNQLESKDLIKAIRVYFQFQTIAGNPSDIDPGEVETINRKFAMQALALSGYSVNDLFPLLDQICSDRDLPLDMSAWKGEFPKFTNDQYEIDLLKGMISDLQSGAMDVALPIEVIEHPSYQALIEGVDLSSLHFQVVRKGFIKIYLVKDQNGIQGRIEKENGQLRFYKQFQNRAEPLQIFSLSNAQQNSEPGLAAIKRLCGNVLFFDPKNREEGLCLNKNGDLQFKVNCIQSNNEIEIRSVIDCRGKKDSQPFQMHTLETLSNESLKGLESFEHKKDILCFIKEGALKKVEFLRYNLSFSVKEGKLICNDPKYRGYSIDLNASIEDKKGFPFALLIKHEDSEMPDKLILSDPAVTKHEIVRKERDLSLVQKLWIMGTGYLGKTPLPEDVMEDLLLSGPQHTEDVHLNYHTFTVRPYTGDLINTDNKDKISGFISLFKQILLIGDFKLAVRPFSRLKLVADDLTKPNVDAFLKLLQAVDGEGGEAASIKIQLALKLKEVMGDKARFSQASAALDTLIVRHCEVYLLQGRKMDQRLCLNKAQFELMASIVKHTDESLFDKSLRVFFVSESEDMPQFSEEDGLPVWQGYAEINLDEVVTESKKAGLYGLEQVPLEDLDDSLPPYIIGKQGLELNPEGIAIIYNAEEIDEFFEASSIVVPDVEWPEIDENTPSCELKAVENLMAEMTAYKNAIKDKKKYELKQDQVAALKTKMEQLQEALNKEVVEKKKALDDLLLAEGDAVQNLSIKAGLQPIATLQELSIAFLQNDLTVLQRKKLLPEGLDLPTLEQALKEYFDVERKATLLQNGFIVLAKIGDASISQAEKQNQSNLLHQILSAKQYYDTQKNPELLVYECFAQRIFRSIGDSGHQINFLKEVLENPSGVFQGVTGAGKTTTISVLRGLMAANGTNLVTFRMLPTLLEQSKAILEEQLGNAFDKNIVTLRFNLKTPLLIKEKKKGENGEEIVEEYSLFQKIYQDLLVVIQQKGSILTDYKSIPLMQEKWIKLNREFLGRVRDGMSIAPIEVEHWQYLRKILILLHEREETLMDEFDVPNRSCNRLQIPLGDPIELPAFMHEKSLELYERLKSDPRLKLAADQQRDISATLRQQVISDLAEEVAEELANEYESEGITKDEMLDYLLGRNENILIKIESDKISEADKDDIVLCKDQFCTFLPLVLKKASELDYKKSADGQRIIPCHEGEPQEYSRFGHPLEEINYTIQDGIQNGISAKEFERWMCNLQNDFKNNPDSDIPLMLYNDIFPDNQFPQQPLNEEQLQLHLEAVNANWDLVKKYLIPKLAEMTASGEVISMTPHDSAAMPQTVSGLSATKGCQEELPESFKADSTQKTGVMGEMAYRLIKRTQENPVPVDYDPENPLEVLEKGKFNAVIDGAGTFRALTPSQVAKKFHSKQNHLQRVGYFTDAHKQDFVGKSKSTMAQKGFYFSKAKARGADVALDPEAKALLTVDGLKSLEDLAQNDGRMRLKGQKIQIARSVNNPEITSTPHLITHCAKNEGAAHSVGLFRSKMQEIPHIVRQDAYEKLLGIEDLNTTLDAFERWMKLFIQEPVHKYENSGDYYRKNKHLRKVEHKPGDVLEAKKGEWINKAKDLGLNDEKLKNLSWSKEVLDKCPQYVSGPNDEVTLGLEIEEEVEVEQDVEVEMDVELEQEKEKELKLDQCGDVPYYPNWISKPGSISAAACLHPAFDPKIALLTNFLPINRTDHLFKRIPFDKAMPKVSMLHVGIKSPTHSWDDDKTIRIEQVLIGDALDDVYHRSINGGQVHECTTDKFEHGFTFDLRTRKIVDIKTYDLFWSWHSRYSEKQFKKDNLSENEALEKLNSEFKYKIRSCNRDAIEKIFNSEEFLRIQVQARFINGQYEGYTNEELEALKSWLKGLDNPEEMKHYFEKVILRTKPRKVDAFRKSPLYKLFDEIKKVI